MTLLPDKCWRGRGEVKRGCLWTKPGMKRRTDGFICLTDSPLSLWTCVYACVPSADSWLNMTVLLPCLSPLWEDGPFWILIGSHPSFWHCWNSFMCVGYLYICSFQCISFIFSCAFLGESILNFHVGNNDSGDSSLQRRVIPEGRVVREKDGEERKWNLCRVK